MSDNHQASQDQPPPILALDLKRIDKGNTFASVTLLFPRWEGLRIHQCLWGKKRDGTEWVLLPSRSWVENGTTHRAQLIEWADTKAAERFRSCALQAIHRLIEQEKAKTGG
jgi:hypothetical protein